MREKNLSATSMGNPQYHAFLRHLADQIPANSPLQFFSFYLDGTPIAAMVTATSERVLDFFIITNNPKFNKYSIGNVLQAHSIAWAHARGLDFDFRWGGSPQKLAWSNEITDITTYQVALTLRGAAPVAREGLRLAAVRLRSRYRRGAGWVVGRLLKPWMLPLKAWALRQAARSSADA